MNKKIVVACVKISMLLMALCVMVAGGFAYVQVQELKLKIKQTQLRKSNLIALKSTLEGDSKVKTSDFKNYLLYSETPNRDKYIEKAQESNEILISRSTTYIEKDIELPKLRLNDCERYKCVQNRQEFTKIPSEIWKGLLGTEDFRFLEHRGVDPVAIARAIVVDIIAMKFVQGGSTLTQQLVKNLFLTNEKKLSRKLKEMVYALYIENVLGKDEIVTLYLNEVFWGTYQNVYIKGFHAASLAYFEKQPQDLTPYESTILVSMLKGPVYYHPVRGLKRLKGRVKAVYRRLQEINIFSKGVKGIWDDKRWEEWSQNFSKRNKNNDFYSYYLISKNREEKLEPFEKLVLLNSIGNVRGYLKERVKGADIGIKILIGDTSCEDYECPGIFSYYSKFERDKRKAMTEEFHQVGSLFKPIVYESFVELGRDYQEDISTEPITLNLKSGKWTPKDYSKAKEETIKLKTALQKSKNIPLVRVASEVGFDKLEEKLAKRIPRLQTPLAEYPAQLLGALELSMVEVFSTYNKFIKDKCIEIKENETPLEETILYYMSVAGETTISKVSRPPLKNANIFGKTGTTNKGLDNWYFAFDGKEVYVFWYGVESARDKHNLRISGAVTSFLIFQNFINFRGKIISEIICD